MRLSCAISFFVLLIFAACKDNFSADSNSTLNEDSLSSLEFPLLIEGGSRVVYQFGKMTPRGLKYFYDTIDVNDQRVVLPDSLKLTFLSPLAMSGQERNNTPGIIAISVPGLWEETIFGKIDRDGFLFINYIEEIKLTPENNPGIKRGNWSGVFRNDSVTVRLTAELTEMKDGEHLAGKGRLFLLEKDKLIEEQEVILVFDAK